MPCIPPSLQREAGRGGAVSRRMRGLSLVELLVAMALGLVLVVGVATVYLFTKGSFTRQAQLSTLQQSVRTAFEYLGGDARMVGHLGCFTGSIAPLRSDLSVTNIATNYGVGIEGYEFSNPTPGSYTLTADNPANATAAGSWRTNTATLPSGPPINTLPLAALGGGLTPGSDVLVVRTVVGKPIRLTADTTLAGTTLAIETVAGGKCSGGTDKVSGFCAGSHGLVASCSAARVFSVASIAASTLTVATGSYPVFAAANAEVFPLQTVAYYVARSKNNLNTTSLYRRIFNGDPTVNASLEQELIQDVDSLQLRYGVDTTVPDGDGAVDDLVNADAVTDWSRVITVRMSVLLRTATPAARDLTLPASAPVNDVAITYPAGSRFERRVFTTTVAVRNKIAYF